MRTIRGVALGTYYAAGANAARLTKNASAMRGLVYAIKDNRDPPNSRQLVNHPRHPAGRAVWVDRTNAIEYVTAIIAKRLANLAKFFRVDDPTKLTLVPVPSSEVTATTIETARFRTLRLCRALAGVGLGSVAILAVQRAPVVAKTKGHRRTAQEILDGFVRTSIPLPRSGTMVLVDDNVQSGSSIAALDRLLGASRPACAFAVAVTDATESEDAMAGRPFTVSYDEDSSPLGLIGCALDTT
jgi:hypothetical protein